ncbi:MAG: membrane protein insertion efficiency factor YidD [Deltaproteobacteria bacterium]|nr:MAG: membrane protein insertion efficiency factor YidD [Deltaproteobacteria bacterium]TMB30652.1 MAG: membrane protein insertion efficiency factor YidD [Deltaproteobacteria bacterium]
MRALAFPLLALLWLYQRLISPALGPACRYYPSCSQYAVEAIRMRGPFVGPILAIRRLLRCHPWAEGGLDPVPLPRRARRIPS